MRARVEDQGGLTALEAAVALVLLLVLLGAALPQLFPTAVAVRTAARELVADLALARQLAVSRAEAHVLEFGPPGGPFTRYTVRRASGPDEPGFPKDLPAGLSVAGPGSVTFLPSGAAELPGTWADWQLQSADESVTVRVWAQTGYARALR